jgi:hypothetical protein
LAALPPGIAKRSIGRLRLRGKENEIELYALAAAVSATNASGDPRYRALLRAHDERPRKG